MPIAVPATQLTPAQASAIAKRGRKLLRKGLLTHRQYALLDCLLWSCRRPSTGAIVVSYTALQRLSRQARGTIAEGLRRLVELRLVTRIKRRIRIAWIGGGQASRQGANAYVLHLPADTEFNGGTVIQGREKIQAVWHLVEAQLAVGAAQRALKDVAARRTRQINQWLTKSHKMGWSRVDLPQSW